MIYICNFHVLSHLLLIYICKLHWRREKNEDRRGRGKKSDPASLPEQSLSSTQSHLEATSLQIVDVIESLPQTEPWLVKVNDL